VVLAEYAKAGVLLVDACMALKIPLVVHFHGVDAYHSEVLKTYGQYYKEMFLASQAVISVSTHMTQTLVALGACPNKIVQIPCGVDTDAFLPTPIVQSTETFLSVGRFESTKGMGDAIRAFAIAHKQRPGIKLRMVGDGSEMMACRDLVKALGIEDSVIFTGILDHAMVREEMRAARALLHCATLPPTGDQEGTPVAILEGAATAIPVLATKVGGIPEAVIHQVTGLLSEPGDIKSVAANIQLIASDVRLASELGANGRTHVFENYSMARQSAKLQQTLREIVQRKSSLTPNASPSHDYPI
jgi:glycosyltransferase involved in cell wall biosynthesis